MANIKFSQFTVGNTESDIDFVVGYKGANNIQISPANLLSATLTGYLPLTGGTMTGDIIFNDGVKAKFGTGLDLNIYHTGTGSVIQNAVGNLTIQQDHNDGDIIFRCDDGSGGTAEYFRIDGGLVNTVVLKDFRFQDDVKAKFGSSNDLKIFHDGTDSVVQNDTGNLEIQNRQDDGDIIFKSDDGSGGVATYFYLDGSIVENRFSKATRHSDNIIAKFGDGNDLKIYHDGSNSNYITSTTSDIYLRNEGNNDRIFIQATYSGTISNYLIIDGSTELVKFEHNSKHKDSVKALFGDSSDLEIYHNAADSVIDNFTGDLYISNKADDKNIVFRCDNGSGGFTEYFRLDGSIVRNVFSKNVGLEDNVQLIIGSGNDLKLFHNGTDSFIINETGNLKIVNGANDSDIVFQSDDGAGGVATYFLLDGSLADGTNFYTRFLDRSRACFGDSIDLQVFHNGTNSYIENNTGDFLLVNYANDKDIKFFSDDGSGGTTEYFRLDGSNTNMNASKTIVFNDDVKASFGDSEDLKILHNGTDSVIINERGNLEIQQRKDDGDIIFKNDDGGGGLITYFLLDGSLAAGSVPVTRFPDNSKLGFGDSTDLQIYHNGSHSYIDETGSGSLFVRADDSIEFKSYSADEFLARFISNDRIELYFNGSKKLETRSTGIKITGVSEYADNTAAIAGGLTTGDVYRTGDLLKIVH